MRLTFVIGFACAALPAFAQRPPSAKEILDSVRMIESRQQIDLQGQLRQEDVVIPFRLVQNGPLIRYSFTNPDETLQLRLGDESQYSNVLLWVDKASGALMRMEGYDWNAQLIKRFEVVSAQKIEGRWFLKQMRVEQLQPGTNHARARAYLEIRR